MQIIDLSNINPTLAGAIIGGLLAIGGSVLVNGYQNWRESRNTRRALKHEIRSANRIIEPILAMEEILHNDKEPNWKDYYSVDESMFSTSVEEDPASICYILQAQAAMFSQVGVHNDIYTSNMGKLGKINYIRLNWIYEYYWTLEAYTEILENILEPSNKIFRDGEIRTDEELEEEWEKLTDVFRMAKQLYRLQQSSIAILEAPSTTLYIIKRAIVRNFT